MEIQIVIYRMHMRNVQCKQELSSSNHSCQLKKNEKKKIKILNIKQNVKVKAFFVPNTKRHSNDK